MLDTGNINSPEKDETIRYPTMIDEAACREAFDKRRNVSEADYQEFYMGWTAAVNHRAESARTPADVGASQFEELLTRFEEAVFDLATSERFSAEEGLANDKFLELKKRIKELFLHQRIAYSVEGIKRIKFAVGFAKLHLGQLRSTPGNVEAIRLLEESYFMLATMQPVPLREAVVHRVIEEGGQDYAVVHVNELARLQQQPAQVDIEAAKK